MSRLEDTLVLCDLDNLLLDETGSIPQLVRDVLVLFCNRGGKLTVFSQRSPKAVRAVLGSIGLAAPALVCGGTLAYQYVDGAAQVLCSFAGQEAALFERLPMESGVGVALQMQDGTTRVLRMSSTLESHLHLEWTPYLLQNPTDLRSEDVLRVLLYQDRKGMPLVAQLEKALGDSATVVLAERAGADTLVLSPGKVSGAEMLAAVCQPAGVVPENVLVLAGSLSMLELMRAAGQSAVAADAPAELRLAAQQITMTDRTSGAAAEVLYRLVRDAEKSM